LNKRSAASTPLLGTPIAQRTRVAAGFGLVLSAPRELALRARPRAPLEPDQVRVRVAGCGVCHTDIGFYTGQVRTRHPLPLVLGHEIAGTVVDAAASHRSLIGREVIVPAVIPCGACELCRTGHDNACQQQIMPGNHADGGFASDLVVPGRCLIPIHGDRGGYELADLAVIADAVTTPYQAMVRAAVAPGDLVVVIGVGGIGTYAVQIARTFGATVAAVDVEQGRLDRLQPFGIEAACNAREMDGGAIKKRLLAIAGTRWKIFEMSGTSAGQELAWSLLVPAATLGIVGFTMDKPQVRLSNLMALDATAFGSWGCSPSLYPAALDLVLTGRITLAPFIERRPLAEGPEVFGRLAASHDGSGRRVILVPEGDVL
jgi:6-hydroxycyclohex-1-ene-1-carbonyl-CoA dehydrogenase